MYIKGGESEKEKKERHETEWRHHINLSGCKPPHKYNREGKASWWSAGIARRTVTDSARRTGRGNLRGVGWDGWTCQRQSGGRAGSKGDIGGRLLSLRRAIHGGVKHGETARMIDGILRRCGHSIGTYPHYSHHSHKKSSGKPPLGHWRVCHAAWWAPCTWFPWEVLSTLS